MSFHLCGMDEAGYGPTLGPLVVGLATLRSSSPLKPAAPWRALAPTICRKRSAKGLVIADSKALHRPSGDLSPLELGVLSFIGCERDGEPPQTFRRLVDHLTQGQGDYLDQYPWYRGADLPLPHSISKLELLGGVRKLKRRLDAVEISVAEVRALPVEVTEFNRGLDEHDSKGEVNAQTMGRFLSWLWRQRDRKNVHVWTDRLGGRQRYGPFLYPLFPNAEFDIVEQGKKNQVYRAHKGDRELKIHFAKECEDLSFTTALASMTAKYLRELHMELFNRWWREHSPDLKRTAGYPGDARRFLDEIDPIRKRLGVDPALLIRRR